MKAFRYMTESEFKIAQNNARNTELSPFAKFCQDLHGHSFTLNGKEIFKWELFAEDYDPEEIINGETEVLIW